jgi:hypothetical protein
LLTTTKVEKSIAAAANMGPIRPMTASIMPTVLKSGDEKILTDDAHGFSREFKKFRNFADIAVHQDDRGERRCQIRTHMPRSAFARASAHPDEGWSAVSRDTSRCEWNHIRELL